MATITDITKMFDGSATSATEMRTDTSVLGSSTPNIDSPVDESRRRLAEEVRDGITDAGDVLHQQLAREFPGILPPSDDDDAALAPSRLDRRVKCRAGRRSVRQELAILRRDEDGDVRQGPTSAQNRHAQRVRLWNGPLKKSQIS